MKPLTLLQVIKKSLLFYWRSNISVLVGVVFACMVITGALIVGDSVRYSLQKTFLMKTGEIEYALNGKARFFRDKLAEEISIDIRNDVIPVMILPGTVSSLQGKIENNIQVMGIDRKFRQAGSITGSTKRDFEILPDEAVINRLLADRLSLQKGDEIIIRIYKPLAFPGDSPFSAERNYITLRVTIKDIIDIKGPGGFSLKLGQTMPLNIFLSLEFLQENVELDGYVNTLLIPEKKNIHESLPEKKNIHVSLADLNNTLKKHWSIEDSGLRLRKLVGYNAWELISKKVFINEIFSEIALKINSAYPLLSYFANSIRLGKRETPYSIISSPPFGFNKIEDNAIIINSWLADDLGAGKGDTVEITYYVMNSLRRLEEKTNSFNVQSVIPIRGYANARTLMPELPGIANADNCRDWNSGIPIDLKKIRDKDEDYWDKYRGTPKAFISLAAAQKLWTNPYGNLTGIRFSGTDRTNIMKGLKEITPEITGFSFQNIRAQGLESGKQSVDFSGLFIGLSFFIIISALILIGLLFVFNMEQRKDELGTLRALGYDSKRIYFLFLMEGLVIAVVGSGIGLLFSVLYSKLILFALKTVWQDAARMTYIYIYIKPMTLFLGFLCSLIVSTACMGLSVFSFLKENIIMLLRKSKQAGKLTKPDYLFQYICIAVCILAIILIALLINPETSRSAGAAFFIAGILLLAAGMIGSNIIISKLSGSSNKEMNLSTLSVSNAVRNRTHSLAIILLISIGIFLVVSISSNQKGTDAKNKQRNSGTGGFDFYCETTFPVPEDLNTSRGRKNLNLDEESFAGVRFIQMSLWDGDDASCLNLNRVAQPKLLGVDPEEFIDPPVFSFARVNKGAETENPWLLLKQELEEDTIPAIADDTVIIWGLGKSIGDSITYINEKGREIKIKFIAGLQDSIFQGHILVSKENLQKHFPSAYGTRVFLVNNIKGSAVKARQELLFAMERSGIEISDTAERLMEFNSVQNTYLMIFLILGGLGIIIGTIGLGVVLMRHAAERRGELALLQAIGYNRKLIASLLFRENAFLLVTGCVIGIIAGLVSVLPNIIYTNAHIPFMLEAIIILGILANGCVWIYISAKFAVKDNFLPALRNE